MDFREMLPPRASGSSKSGAVSPTFNAVAGTPEAAMSWIPCSNRAVVWGDALARNSAFFASSRAWSEVGRGASPLIFSQLASAAAASAVASPFSHLERVSAKTPL